jgi:hypothetical protein
LSDKVSFVLGHTLLVDGEWLVDEEFQMDKISIENPATYINNVALK